MQFSELKFVHNVRVCAGIWFYCGFDAVYQDFTGLLDALARFVNLQMVDETLIAQCVAEIGLPVNFFVSQHLADFPIAIARSSVTSLALVIASCLRIFLMAKFVVLLMRAFPSLRICAVWFTSADTCVVVSLSVCGAESAECRAFLRVCTPTSTTWS